MKEYVTAPQFARLVDHSEYTVRTWCQQARIRAERVSRRHGSGHEWMIHRSEIDRFMTDGPLPPDRPPDE